MFFFSAQWYIDLNGNFAKQWTALKAKVRQWSDMGASDTPKLLNEDLFDNLG